MDKNELQLLAQKYLDGTATPEEKQMLDQWYDTIHNGWHETVDLDKPDTEEIIRQRVFDDLSKKLFFKTPVKIEKALRIFYKTSFCLDWLSSCYIGDGVFYLVVIWSSGQRKIFSYR